METVKLQRLLDHWHLGKIERFTVRSRYYRVRTNQGVFIVVEYSRQEW